jgi:hypothetical protein
MGLNRQVRGVAPRTYPSMMLRPAASHGNALNADWTGKNPGRIAFRRPSTSGSCPFRQDPRLALDASSGEFSGDRTVEPYSLPDPRQQAVAGAGQTVSTRLSTRRAGVHVDFHAHRHFHNLRSLPTHQGPPKQCWHDVRADIKTRLTSNVAQARNTGRLGYSDASDARNFSLGQGHFALGQSNRTEATDRRIRRIVTVHEISLPAEAILSKEASVRTRRPGPKR